MRISCPSCQSSYKIADEKVKGRTVKVRCRKCGMMIHVNEHGVANAADASGAQQPPQEAGATGATDGGGALFSVLIAEGDQRDMGMREIVDAYNCGRVTSETFVWAEGQPDWMPLGQVPAIVDALNAASLAVDAVAATDATTEPPFGVEPPVLAPAPATFAAKPQPAHEPRPAPAAQLFGGASAQPAPAPAAAAAPQAPLLAADASNPEPSPLFGGGAGAAVRENRRATSVDLFGAQASAGADEEVATSAPHVGPAAGAKPLGARDESSVLFSLSALTAAAGTTKAAGAPGGSNGKEDSGLIDLRALADKKADAAPAAGAHPTGGGAILDAAPLLGTPLVDPSLHQLHGSDPPAAMPGKGSALAIGLAVGGIAVAGAIIAVVWRLTATDAAPDSTVTSTAIPEATTVETAPPVVPTSTGASAAAAPATGAPAVTAEPNKAAPKHYGRGGYKPPPKSGGGSTGAAKPPSTPAAKSPPKNRCNCAPGDLACNMACAVK
ncbi:MAG: zinc-ribbon domain-containing protein [Polyangiaceae bacterium]|jgi:predicted Zn finger-like uncharacterized protein|nr:zinc-ribbon domain-containing protein [Polyangiaceae bacterium]